MSLALAKDQDFRIDLAPSSVYPFSLFFSRSMVERLEASSAETANVADLDAASLAAH